MEKEKLKRGRPLADTMFAPWPELLKYEGQSKIARKLGVSQTTVGKWARGVHRIPELAKKELRRLCKRYGIEDSTHEFKSAS